MTKSIKITRTALTVQISFDKGEAGADYPSCAYLDRNYIEFMPLLEEVDK